MKVINEEESINYKHGYFSKTDFLFIELDQLIKPKLNTMVLLNFNYFSPGKLC